MNKLAKGIVKFKWLIIVVVIALTAFLGYQAKDLKIDSDIISSLPDDDPAALLYKNIGKEFGGNDMGMIIIETDDVFKKEVIEYVKQITDTLIVTDGISTVTSLTNVLDIKGSEWGIEIGTLLDEYPPIDLVVVLIGGNDMLMRLARDTEYHPLEEKSIEQRRGEELYKQKVQSYKVAS